MFGGAPGIGVSRSRPSAGRLASRPRVYGCVGWRRGVDVAALDGAAGVHHLHPVGDAGDHAEVVGDEHDRRARTRAGCARCTSRIWACTVTSSAVVGSSAISTSGSLAIAIAIITRWRMPPENSCGYCVRAGLRLRDADEVEQLDGAVRGLRPWTRRWCERIISAIWSTDPVHRVERRQRILEDHRRSACRACAAHRAVGSAPTSSMPVRPCRARDHAPTSAAGPSPEERDRLAGAGLADDAEHLAGGDVEVDAANRLDAPLFGLERDPAGRGSTRTGSARRSLAALRRCLGSSASRSPSPMKLMQSDSEHQERAREHDQPPVAATARSPSTGPIS